MHKAVQNSCFHVVLLFKAEHFLGLKDKLTGREEVLMNRLKCRRKQ